MKNGGFESISDLLRITQLENGRVNSKLSNMKVCAHHCYKFCLLNSKAISVYIVTQNLLDKQLYQCEDAKESICPAITHRACNTKVACWEKEEKLDVYKNGVGRGISV